MDNNRGGGEANEITERRDHLAAKLSQLLEYQDALARLQNAEGELLREQNLLMKMRRVAIKAQHTGAYVDGTTNAPQSAQTLAAEFDALRSQLHGVSEMHDKQHGTVETCDISTHELATVAAKTLDAAVDTIIWQLSQLQLLSAGFKRDTALLLDEIKLSHASAPNPGELIDLLRNNVKSGVRSHSHVKRITTNRLLKNSHRITNTIDN